MRSDPPARSKTPRGGRDTSAEEVRAQLERILGHRDFEASTRVREFLRFVVEETLAGRADALKGYTIALEVFGREKDFDANLDPIVRIQAGRLRRALEHYYLVAGGADSIVISVPRGGYVPVFTRQDRPTVDTDGSARSAFDTAPGLSSGVSLSVLPIQEIPVEAENDFFAEGLREELCNELSRYQDLSVIPCRKEMFPVGEAVDHTELGRRLNARFLLEGSVRRGGEIVKVSVRLIDGREGRQLWAQGYRRPLTPGGLIEIQEEIARDVAVAIGSEYGVISRRLANEARNIAPAQLSTYEAVLRWYDFQIEPTREAGSQCLAALQAAVQHEPEYGPAWAALALLTGRAYTLDLPGIDDPLGKMAEYARKGATLAPRRQLTQGAMAQYHFLMREREAFLREIEATLQLNPGSPFYAGAAGYLLVLAGELERGRSLLTKAIATNPCYPRWFNHGLCVYHYQKGDFDRAYQETLKPAFGIHFWGPLLEAAVLGQLGRTVEARSAASRLLDLVPDFESRARDLTSRPVLSTPIVDGLLDGLRKAGLHLGDDPACLPRRDAPKTHL